MTPILHYHFRDMLYFAALVDFRVELRPLMGAMGAAVEGAAAADAHDDENYAAYRHE